MQTVLVVDDEPAIRELVSLYLTQGGFKVATAGAGEEGLQLARQQRPSLVVLDIMLPGMDGLEVLRQLRKLSDVPVLMLTARGDDVDRIVGLEVGADDYLPKPFNPRELVARVRAVLRRAQAGTAERTLLRAGDLEVDRKRREARVNGQLIELRAKEFDLLAAFAENPGIVLTRDQLLENVWGYDYAGETRTVDVHVNHLRQKLTGAYAQIQTVRGVGYRLVAEEV